MNQAELRSIDVIGEAKNFAERLVPALMQKWQGTIFNMERGSVKISEVAELPVALAARIEPLLASIPPDRLRPILSNTSIVLSAFLHSKELVSNVDQEGLIDLVCLSIESCNDPQFLADTEIRIGFGASDLTSPNARVPAYILPAKKILDSLLQGRERQEFIARADLAHLGDLQSQYQKLRSKLLEGKPLTEEQGATVIEIQKRLQDVTLDPERTSAIPFPQALPRVVVYSAHNFIANTNDVDPAQVRINAAQNKALMRRYLEIFCDPRVAEKFVFDEDQEVAPESVLARQLEFFASCLQNTTNREGQKNVEKVVRMGKKHAGENAEGSMQYAAAHAVYSGDAVRVPSVGILRDAHPQPTKLIMIGGEPEKTFWRVRQTVACEATINGGIDFFRKRLEAIGVVGSDGYGEILKLYESATSNGQSERLFRAQLITKIGELPVYAKGFENDPSAEMLARGTLSFTDFLAMKMARTSLKEDLLQLVADLAGISPQEVPLLLKSKTPEVSSLQKFEEGYGKLCQLCREAQVTQ